MNVRSVSRKWMVGALLLVAGIPVGALGAWLFSWWETKSPAVAEREARHASVYRRKHNLHLVYIGSAGCAFCERDDLRSAVRRMVEALEDRHATSDTSFTSLGVSIDWDPAEGTSYLRRIARFDEVAVGMNWLNLGSLAYMVRDPIGDLATPQVLLLSRSVRVVGARLEVGRDSVLTRRVGVDHVLALAAEIEGSRD